ncbi:hypothetical protein [Ruminococcus bromii]|uniref:hypothetical protein n=1 Tax=Ruminococcus bromii TaxID=40518 RepID=UPI00241D6434|nr:hypothetical protein [Ruminococcus bromii]
MKANWKARNKQYNDRQKGEIFDVGIGYGLELASVVLNHYFGFGAKRLYQLNIEALHYIHKMKDDAEQYTEEYKDNVEYGSIKMHREFEKIMALKYHGIDYGEKLRNTIDSGSYLIRTQGYSIEE